MKRDNETHEGDWRRKFEYERVRSPDGLQKVPTPGDWTTGVGELGYQSFKRPAELPEDADLENYPEDIVELDVFEGVVQVRLNGELEFRSPDGDMFDDLVLAPMASLMDRTASNDTE